MLGLNSDAVATIGIVFGVLSNIGVVVVGKMADNAQKLHDAELTKVRDDGSKELAAARAETAASLRLMAADLARAVADSAKLAENLKTAWTKIDELRESAVRKADLKEYRDEVRGDMKALGDRLEQAIDQLRMEMRERKGAS